MKVFWATVLFSNSTPVMREILPIKSGVACKPEDMPSMYSLAEFMVKIDQLEVTSLAVKLEGF